jgi:hypothetical protein
MFKLLRITHEIEIPEGVRAWFLTILALVPALWLLGHGQFNVLASLIIFMLIYIVSLNDRTSAILMTFVYLFLLGDIRRLIGYFIGFPKLDPLLLVGPILSAILAAPILFRLRLRGPLSKAAFALMVIMVLEIFNPRQGGIIVGISGALFYLVPFLWFWIGQRYGTESVVDTLIYRIVIPVGFLAGLLGIFQTYIGFLPWEQAWLSGISTHSFNLGNGLFRSFGFSVNGVEYTDLLLISSVSAAAAFFAGRRPYSLFLLVLLPALFLASSRTSIVKLLFAIAAAWAISNKGGRGWAVRLPFALAGGIGLLAFLLSQAGGGASSSTNAHASAADISTQHQVEGLSHPLDNKKSTANLHLGMFMTGITEGIHYPIGYGLGATTLGAGKFGGDPSASGSSEVDISDAYITMGLVGGGLYSFTIFLVIRRALTYGRTAPRHLGLPLLGMLASLGGAWIALGQYAIAPLAWFLIGVLSRSEKAAPSVARFKAKPVQRLVPLKTKALP